MMSDPITDLRRPADPGRPASIAAALAAEDPVGAEVPHDDRRSLRRAMVLVGLVVAFAAACGIPARAAYGAPVTAGEPQYLLTADALARTGDLDIGPGLRAQTWRAYHHDVALPRQTAVRPHGQRLSPHDPLLPVVLALPMRVGGWAGAKA